MALRINTNTPSMEAQMNLGKNQIALQTSFNKLSSGFRINSAADDAAGLGISESMKSQIRSFVVAERNANDAVSMVQTAEGALGEVHSIMQRMRELAIQGANGSLSSTDRGYLDVEFSALKSEIGRIQDGAKFNGKQLLSTTAVSYQYQVGLDNTAADQLTLTFGGVAMTSLLAGTTVLSGATAGNALAALGRIDSALTAVSTKRADFGAAMNRLGIVTNNIQTSRLNLSAANSRIRDVDIAAETARMTRNQILSQAGVSVLAQANQLPQMALNLLGG